jgi:cytochrome P450
MTPHLSQLDAMAPSQRWPLARGWIAQHSRAFYAELRAHRPVCALPELTLVSRYADCAQVLRRHDLYGVDLYKPKQGPYWMAQDDTPEHWRDKSVMRAILNREDVPRMRGFVAEETARRLAAARGSIDYVWHIGRGVPIALVQRFFGFSDGDPRRMADWSYWNQQDAFHNQPFDDVTPEAAAHITRERHRAGREMARFLIKETAQRAAKVKLGFGGDDPLSRLLRLSFSGGLDNFGLKRVVLNTGGLLIGAVETTAHATANALAFLMANPPIWADARVAALQDDASRFDGFVWEALRFAPAFPWFFRTAKPGATLGDGGGAIAPGTTVLALTAAAMFDGEVFADPERFDPARGWRDGFTFGQGIHECLGRAVAEAMLPEILRQVARLDTLEAGPIQWKGGVPDKWELKWRAQ